MSTSSSLVVSPLLLSMPFFFAAPPWTWLRAAQGSPAIDLLSRGLLLQPWAHNLGAQPSNFFWAKKRLLVHFYDLRVSSQHLQVQFHLNPSRLSSCTGKQGAGARRGSPANEDNPHLRANVLAHFPLVLKSNAVNKNVSDIFTLPFPIRAVSQVSSCPAL